MILKKEVPSISFLDIARVNGIFETQGWPVDDTNKSSLYNRFLRTYRKLGNEERELFMKLSSMYKWVHLSEYQKLAIELMERAITRYYSPQSQDIWVYPAKKSEDTNLIKSSDLVAYLCNSVQFQHSSLLYKKKFHVLGSLDILKQKRSKFCQRPLLILDDYIGSGKYVSEVVAELGENSIPPNHIVVCTLFISQNGAEKVLETGCNIEYIEKLPNILSELTPQEQGLLTQIEESLCVEEQFKSGFGGAASLVTLLRTPNNSLPLFWLDRGRTHDAPFPR